MDHSKRTKALLFAAGTVLLISALAAPVAAHTGHGTLAGGFLSGFSHPVGGLDHIVAMVAVGLWGAFLGAPSLWLLPVVFPLVMAFAAVLGVLGISVPAVETGIALSAVVLGLAVALRLRPPIWLSALLVGVFAIFHGHAHGAELPAATNPAAYALGFVIATGLLHLAGMAFGSLTRWPAGVWAVRAGGGIVSLVGLAFLAGAT
ncbi:MAG: HupE/UreJ family protein [Pseudomonadota bacterium]